MACQQTLGCNMQLGRLIQILQNAPKYLVVENGFGEPMSYRGYYDQLAFEPAERTTMGEMLMHAQSALNATFTGYKGGDFVMHERTSCYVAAYGEVVENPILEADVDRWLSGEPSHLIKESQDKVGKLQQERDECNEDLICTQKSLSELETKYESISNMFCDSDGNPIFEPFNDENLSIWLKAFAIEQQAKGIEDLKSKASEYLWNHNDLEIHSNLLVQLLTNFCTFHSNQLRTQAKQVGES